MISSFVVFSFWLHPQEQNEWTEQSYKNLSKISEMTKKKKTPHKYIDYHITFFFQNVYHCNHLPIHIAFTMGWKHPVKEKFLGQNNKNAYENSTKLYFVKLMLKQLRNLTKSSLCYLTLAWSHSIGFHTRVPPNFLGDAPSWETHLIHFHCLHLSYKFHTTNITSTIKYPGTQAM